MAQVAPARTFTIYEDIEELLKLGKIRGGSLDSAIVIKGDKILSKEPLRFKDEFVRHKILDIIGDITLLGMPLKAHIVATRPGHALNAELTKALFERLQERKKGGKKKGALRPTPAIDVQTLDIRSILDILPHRYPFVMIDRVVEIVGAEELVAIKNVTFNEPYFNGHFPGNPVMPGVLQLEAMAQAAGVLIVRWNNWVPRPAFFMSADKVKFRKPVQARRPAAHPRQADKGAKRKDRGRRGDVLRRRPDRLERRPDDNHRRRRRLRVSGGYFFL